MTVRGYCRLSQADLRAPGSTEDKLANRRTFLQSLARAHGYDLPEAAIVCEVESGGTIEQRPAFRTLLSEIEAGRCSVLVSTEYSRLSRGDKRDEADLEDLFCAANLVLVTTEGVTDYGSEEYNPLPADMLAALARHELRQTARRMKRAKTAAVLRNEKASGPAAYGYSYDRATRAYTPRTDEYPVLLELLERVRTRGESVLSVIRDFNARGIPPPAHASHWLLESARAILSNPIYAGYHVSRETKRGVGKRGRVVSRDEPIWAEREGTWVHPLTLAEYEELQRLVHPGRRTGPHREKLLSGLLWCEAGARMHGTKWAQSPTYRCLCKYAGIEHPGRAVGARRIHAWVLDCVRAVLARMPDELGEAGPTDRATLSSEYSEARRELQRRERVLRAHVASEVDQRRLYGDALYEAARARLSAEREEACRRVEACESTLAEPDPAELLPLLAQVRAAPWLIDEEHSRPLLQAMVRAVRLWPIPPGRRFLEGATIEWQPWCAGFAPRRLPSFPGLRG